MYSLEIKLTTGEAYMWHSLSRRAAMAIIATYADLTESIYLALEV